MNNGYIKIEDENPIDPTEVYWAIKYKALAKAAREEIHRLKKEIERLNKIIDSAGAA